MFSKLRKITNSTFSFAESAVLEKTKNILNEKFSTVGTIDDLKFSNGTASIRVLLRGESAPVYIEVAGLSYQTHSGRFILYFERIRCLQKEWLQAIFDIFTEKLEKKIEFEDSLKLLPLKAILPQKN